MPRRNNFASEHKYTHIKFMSMSAILILVIAASVYAIHYANVQREKRHEEEIARIKEEEKKALEETEKRYADEIMRLKSNEESENKYAEEIEKHKASEHKAIVERNRAQNEADSLRVENESMRDTANRYKNQLETLRAENEKLKAEVTRLTNKLNNSLVRIANPFK